MPCYISDGEKSYYENLHNKKLINQHESCKRIQNEMQNQIDFLSEHCCLLTRLLCETIPIAESHHKLSYECRQWYMVHSNFDKES